MPSPSAGKNGRIASRTKEPVRKGYTTKELAERFQVTPRTIQRWVTNGALPVLSAHRARYLMESEQLATFQLPQESEQGVSELVSSLETLKRQMAEIETRVQHLERRKIVVVLRWHIKK